MKKMLTLPNVLTLVRIVFLAPYMYFLKSSNWVFLIFALVIFVISGITDFLDGFTARKMKLQSTFGKFFDPLADKIVIISSLIGLVVYHDNLIPLWSVILILIRELTISDFRLISFTSKKSSLNTALFAKIKTFLLFISVTIANIIAIIKSYYGEDLILSKFIILIPTFIMAIAIYFAYHSGIVYLLDSLSENLESKDQVNK